ncbi:MAG: hypothetical protein R3F07_11970 [Opitutaceae bacterium]
MLAKGETFGTLIRERIRHEITKNLHRYRYCPHIDWKLIEAAIHQLPDSVNPENDRDWTYNEAYGEIEGTVPFSEVENYDGEEIDRV